jgi:hypothetical protein
MSRSSTPILKIKLEICWSKASNMKVSDFKNKLFQLVDDFGPQEEIEKTICDFFVTKPALTLSASYPFLARARINVSGEIFSKTSQLSYNPDPSKINMQRANYAGQQVFYGAAPAETKYADVQSTALVEACMKHVRDHSISYVYLTIGKWIVHRPLRLTILPFSSLSVEKNDDFKRANENYESMFAETFGDKSSEAIRYFKDSLEFMSDIFCQINNKEKCYPISAAYYNGLYKFSEKKKIYLDGLIYPSANTEAAGMNITLRKETIDDGSVSLDSAIMVKMQRNPSNPKLITFQLVSDEQKPDVHGNFSFKHVW